MSAQEQANEPSMEDILASIRKIISDEDESATNEEAIAAPPEPAPKPVDEAEQDAAFEAAEADVFADVADEEPAFEAIAEDTTMVTGDEIDDLGILELETDAIVEDSVIDDLPMVTEPLPEEDDIAFAEADPEPAPEPAPPPSAPPAMAAAPAAPPPAEALLSTDSNAAVSAAFSNLAHTILSKDARTLEDLVKELMRPMLKSWLDDNLPSLVERMVREEIERVSRGSR